MLNPTAPGFAPYGGAGSTPWYPNQNMIRPHNHSIPVRVPANEGSAISTTSDYSSTATTATAAAAAAGDVININNEGTTHSPDVVTDQVPADQIPACESTGTSAVAGASNENNKDTTRSPNVVTDQVPADQVPAGEGPSTSAAADATGNKRRRPGKHVREARRRVKRMQERISRGEQAQVEQVGERVLQPLGDDAAPPGSDGDAGISKAGPSMSS
ncbi:hypothetical protein DHEL01_v205755 [Diaporthe helianthi]|uniref:Uncharacterized protein n=1 Tax=Diaporthe helianthi TaxID=158607 RepID=A0A2P5I060_DIAHE|nr:hypothetical protein DHEL01_v205755 [Diaporthe helianthi]